MLPFSLTSSTLGFLIATALAARGVRRRSLSKSGAAAAWIVGFLSVAAGLRGTSLLLFYMVGTAATKFRHAEKARIDATAQVGAERGPSQVLACSAVGVVCSVWHAVACGEERAIDFEEEPLASSLACAIISHYATCLADTLASEMGILASHTPILITKPWVSVPAGTNGGITLSGTLWSGFGGLVIAIGVIILDMMSGITVWPLRTVIFGTMCGLVGSLLDSLFGATLQSSYYDDEKRVSHCGEEGNESISKLRHISGANILTNAQVNLASVILTTVVGAVYMGPLVYSYS
mmetsp:Transcript_17657/g.29354  ORF Transcript_17657/g.29354 Transcript_17657/m.29354 type:complete len:292 (+) Transcript_17657:79-954(+)